MLITTVRLTYSTSIYPLLNQSRIIPTTFQSTSRSLLLYDTEKNCQPMASNKHTWQLQSSQWNTFHVKIRNTSNHKALQQMRRNRTRASTIARAFNIVPPSSNPASFRKKSDNINTTTFALSTRAWTRPVEPSTTKHQLYVTHINEDGSSTTAGYF